MKIVDVCNTIEEIAPIQLAEDWDNVGLLIGNFEQNLTGIVISLDLTFGVIDWAIRNKCNLIITHHPAIFSPLKNMLCQDFSSNLVAKCIKNNINVYSSHTNMDLSDNGINFAFAKMLNVEPTRFLSDGLGVYGEYKGNFDKLLSDIKNLTKDSEPKTYFVKDEQSSQKIAFIAGSGGRIDEIVIRCKDLEINTIISSEFKHNILLELLASNVNVIQIGHFESEIIFVEIIYNLLKSKSNKLFKYVSLT